MNARPSVNVHRFHQCAGLAILNNDGTVYLTAKQCRATARALFKVARSIERERFHDSAGLTVSVPAHAFIPNDG